MIGVQPRSRAESFVLEGDPTWGLAEPSFFPSNSSFAPGIAPSGMMVGYDRFTAATLEIQVLTEPSYPLKGRGRSIARLVLVALAPTSPSRRLLSTGRITPHEFAG